MPGMIVGLAKQEGDQVNKGETVMVLEAMKMENGLPAPVSGTVKKISFGVGDHVKKNDVLCIIS
jgi:oxaloacetate decarboxylase alpha subunit/pyruvate carboxylase subunit B